MTGPAAFAQGAATLAIGAGAGVASGLFTMSGPDWGGAALGFALALILNRLDELRAELRAIRAAVDRLGARHGGD
ncbi:hypothetical protein [Methylocella sp.]|uniref:hypothetical protein n=1 Tax=Methylocella sp. TaxID=1978226 RepID=UPI003783C731